MTQQHLRLDEIVRLRLSPWIGQEIKVLEAGCGARSPIDFGNRAHVIGLDVDREAMHRNEELDETIVGDLESYPLPAEAFDIVFCRYVLEHLRKPERALANMRQALRAGGWLMLIFPNRRSLKGLVTRLTPHSLHRLGYRVLFGRGFSPCETRFASSVSVDGIRNFAESADLHVLALEYHPGKLRLAASQALSHSRQPVASFRALGPAAHPRPGQSGPEGDHRRPCRRETSAEFAMIAIDSRSRERRGLPSVAEHPHTL